MSKPFVLLGMTSFNREAFIAEAIESVLAQDYTGWKLQIVDDGSTDKTRSIIESYVRLDDRIQATYLNKNQGFANALKEASKEESTYLGWIDSDDALTPDALSELIPFMVSNPHLDCVYSQYNTMNVNGTDTGLGYRCQIPYSKERLLVDFMIFHFKFMKWSAYQSTGLSLNFKASIDYDFFLRFSEKHSIGHFPKSLYRYREHAQSISGNGNDVQRYFAEVAINDALKRRNLSDQVQLLVKDKRFSLEAK